MDNGSVLFGSIVCTGPDSTSKGPGLGANGLPPAVAMSFALSDDMVPCMAACEPVVIDGAVLITLNEVTSLSHVEVITGGVNLFPSDSGATMSAAA